MMRLSLVTIGIATAMVVIVGTMLPSLVQPVPPGRQSAAVLAPSAYAAASRIEEGLNEIGNRVDIPTGNRSFREAVVAALNFLVKFVVLAAVLTVIVAGFFLILGFGTEASVQRAKKIFIYTIIGILVIFFVRVIVAFFTIELPSVFP